jgi:hypothetical protein
MAQPVFGKTKNEDATFFTRRRPSPRFLKIQIVREREGPPNPQIATWNFELETSNLDLRPACVTALHPVQTIVECLA